MTGQIAPAPQRVLTNSSLRSWVSLSTVCLLSIAAFALILRIFIASSQNIGYDAWWDIHTATEDRWKNAVAEYRANAHPPLFYLVVRVIHFFTSNQWGYRAVAIFPGAVSTLFIGLIVRKLTESAPIALVTALAFAISRNAVEISTDVRSYSLAICLVLGAYLFFLDFAIPASVRSGPRSLLGFSLLTTLAIATEYYALFFFVSCLATICALTCVDTAYRKVLLAWARQNIWAILVGLTLPLVLLQYLYRTHIKLQPQSGFGHLSSFYWDPASHEPALDFLMRNGQIIWNTFTVFSVHSQASFIGCILSALVIVLFAMSRLQKGPLDGSIRLLAPVFVLITILLLMMGLSLARKYPFGGMMRQQSILMPLVFIVTAVVYHSLITNLPAAVKRILLLASVVGLVLNFRSGWRDMSGPGWDRAQAQFDNFGAKSGSADGVFLDQFDLTIYYAHTYDSHWTFDKRVNGPTRFDIYKLTSPAGQQTQIIRAKDWWNFAFNGPRFYSDVAAVLHSTNVHHLAVFCNLQGVDQFAPAARQQLFNDVSVYAHTAGLRIDSLTTYGGEVTAVFSLDKPAQKS